MNKPYAFLLSGTFRCLSLCMVALNITTVCLGRQVLRVPEREPLADQFGTPAYVYSRAALEAQIARRADRRPRSGIDAVYAGVAS